MSETRKRRRPPRVQDFLTAVEGVARKPHCPQFRKETLLRVCLALDLGNVIQHRLRATFASLHAEAGTPVREIQGMLGHKNIATTMIHVETSLDPSGAPRMPSAGSPDWHEPGLKPHQALEW